MMDSKDLSKLKENVEEALKKIIQKGADLSPAELDNATKAVCLIEKIGKMERGDMDAQADEYSGRSYGMPPHSNHYPQPGEWGRGSYDGSYGAGSYNGGSHNSRGGSYDGSYEGNSSRRGRSRDSGYSGHSIVDRAISQLERMMDETDSPYEREKVSQMIRGLEANKGML